MWFIRFTVFHLHEYRFHAYILTIIFQFRFLFYSQLSIHCFFMLQILINIFRPVKIETKSFWISYYNYIFFHFYNGILTMKYFLVILVCRYKKYSICLISFYNLFESFTTFICANNIESLVNNLFGVKRFNPFPSFTCSLPSSDGM